MRKVEIAGYLIATSFLVPPALAQTATAPTTNSPAAASSAMSVNAADFVTVAANSNMFEIQSSQLALDKTQDSRVRDFAQRMIKDHTQAGDKMKAAAQNQTVPTNLDPEHSRMLQQLQQASGNDFTRNYVQMQLDGHQKAVALFDSYAANGDNQQLKQFAQQTAPTLREHLQQITQIRTAMAGSGNQNQAAQSGMAGAGQSGDGGLRMADTATVAVKFVTVKPAVVMSSKLVGIDIYNNQNEKLGEVDDLVIDNGKTLSGLVVGVGGFLGLGESYVVLDPSTVVLNQKDGNWRAFVDTNKDTLKSAPKFQYSKKKM